MIHHVLLKFSAAICCCSSVVAISAAGVCAPVVHSNGFVALVVDGETITSLRFDADGSGNYGIETIAAGGALRGVKSVSLSGNALTIYPANDSVEWDIPFLKAGYYDADTHINYPHDLDTEDAISLILPFECFTSSCGQYLRIEHFKRIEEGFHWSWMNIEDGNTILMRSDSTQNWDLEVTMPGTGVSGFDPRDDRLILKSGRLTSPVVISVLRRGLRHMPSNKFLMPSAKFTPDAPVTFRPTGKTLPVSRVMTEFLRMGIFWDWDAQCNGEWVLCSELHFTDDPRSWYIRKLRKELLVDQGWMGYDRFGHFGYQFMWERYPDYGAGGWLNTPTNNAPYDMRMLHINGMRVLALVRYVLATGDRDFLRARRARNVSTDGTEQQPICGADSDTMDYVLAAGDLCPDGRSFPNKHSLGQEFTANAPFSAVKALLGNPSLAERNSGRLVLYDRYQGNLIADAKVSIAPNTSEQVSISVGRTLPPGKYYLELTDDDSGKRYFGAGMVWWSDVDADYRGGDAYSGPFHGDIADYIRVLFDYMYKYMGAEKENLISYINDREYNVPDQRSGVHKKCMANSYWEGAGGAYDSYIALWYNAACSAMADLREFESDRAGASYYRHLKKLADEAYNKMFWHTAVDNGRIWRRYFACKDWNGEIHDYGYTYNNLEAAARDIPSPEQVKNILRWLDRGQYTPDPRHKQWKDHIYSIWEMHAPFSTIDNHDWLPISETIYYMGVVSNGGGRLETSARDLWVRRKYLSIDNMHERNEKILSRFINPDRLTGGRTYTEHWIGRWFFLGPSVDIADIEGFREIMPGSGLAASCQPLCYFGMDFTPRGLKMDPRVPSKYESVEFDSIGYWGAVFNFKAKALRRDVVKHSGSVLRRIEAGKQITVSFSAKDQFNKVGVKVAVKPFRMQDWNGLSLVLEERAGKGWKKIAENWYSSLADGQETWVDAGKRLSDGEYRVRIGAADPERGETISVYCRAKSDSPALRVVDEQTAVTVEMVYNPKGTRFVLSTQHADRERTRHDLGGRRTVTLNAGETLLMSDFSLTTGRADPEAGSG